MSHEQQKLTDLEYQVTVLNRQIQQLLDEQVSKRDFLAHIAHELRTPLNTIIGFAQILERHTQVSGEQQEYLSLILLSSEHLLSLINDILQMSKLEAGEITINHAEVDLLKLIEGIESIYRAEAKEKGLNFELNVAEDLPRYILGDSSKIRQVLSNLLSNAIKFTDSGSVSLMIFPEYVRHHTDTVELVFSVRDTGRGIADDEMKKLFQPYQQTATGEASNTGTGLGLAITQHLVELMDGHIEVDSEWEKGTTFTAKVQVGRVANQSERVNPDLNIVSLEKGTVAHRILIVDDNDNNRNLLNNILHKVGFDIKVAEDGQQAVDVFKTWQPDLILMDMRMPRMNGYQATEHIRTLDTTDDVIIIALTADAFATEGNAAIPTGCDDYIVKPFRISALLRKLGDHLNLPVIYDETSQRSVNNRTKLIDSELTSLTPDIKERLGSVVSSYSVERVNSIIDDLPPNLANFITECLDEFDFEAILSLVSAKRA